MKFKSIFIVFCTALLLFMTIIVIMKFIMLDVPLAQPYLRFSWLLLLVLAIFLVGFNVFYFTNRRLFLLLEKEDWPALSRYLENRVIKKGKYSPGLVSLLAKTYLLLSDAVAVMSLENKVALAKPALVGKNAIIFGTARVLGKDISGAVRFFKAHKETAKAEHREWTYWYYGFALLLDRQFEEAAKEFSFLARISKDAVITGLSSYFLADTLAPLLPGNKDELLEVSFAGRERVRKALPLPKDWGTEISRFSSEIHIATIMKYIKEAGAWIYSE